MQIFMKHFLILFILTAHLFACNQRKPSNVGPAIITPNAEDNYSASTTILMLDERLNNVDSLVFVFYKDPLGKDSLRYTRYYTQYSTINTKDISILKAQINQSTERFEKVKKCRSLGKVWCFTKGEIFQTLYFSDFGVECSFMYFIKNGQFYYCNLTENFKNIFINYRAISK